MGEAVGWFAVHGVRHWAGLRSPPHPGGPTKRLVNDTQIRSVQWNSAYSSFSTDAVVFYSNKYPMYIVEFVRILSDSKPSFTSVDKG